MRVHDLKRTFGRRLRAAGVSFEGRQDFLVHKSGRIANLSTATGHAVRSPAAPHPQRRTDALARASSTERPTNRNINQSRNRFSKCDEFCATHTSHPLSQLLRSRRYGVTATLKRLPTFRHDF